MKSYDATFRLAAWLLLSVTLAAGCSKSAAGRTAVTQQPEPGPSPTEAEADRFASIFLLAIKSGDAATVNQSVDWNAIIRKATAGIEINEFGAAARRGLLDVAKDSPFAAGLIQVVGKGGTVRLLRIHEVDGRRRALFRVLSDQGVNYLDFLLERTDGSSVRAFDIDSPLVGGLVSADFRRLYFDILNRQPKSPIDDSPKAKDYHDFLASSRELAPLFADYQELRYDDAMNHYRRLSESVKSLRLAKSLRVKIAERLNNKEALAAAFEDYRASFPDDSTIDLQGVNYYINAGEFAKALDCINRIDHIMGDSYLDSMRADVYLAAGDVPQARETLNHIMLREPDLIQPYWVWIMITLKERKFDETVKALNAVHEKFQIEIEDIEKVPVYTDFVKSPEYRAWSKPHSLLN